MRSEMKQDEYCQQIDATTTGRGGMRVQRGHGCKRSVHGETRQTERTYGGRTETQRLDKERARTIKSPHTGVQ